MNPSRITSVCLVLAFNSILVCHYGFGQDRGRRPNPILTFPPKLPGEQKIVSVHSEKLLLGPPHLAGDVVIAKEPPKID